MNICVYGLWHLGSVTAACLADAGVKTIGVDVNVETVAGLSKGIPPLFEPGLEELTKTGLAAGKLSFTTDVALAVVEADLVWVTFDTPVDEEDRTDIDFVKRRVEEMFPYLKDGTIVLISSQLPVGSTAELEGKFASTAAGRRVSFAYSPENLRLGGAIKAFTDPERIVIGVRNGQARQVIEPVMSRFCDSLLWNSVESAEMVKHALNAFLATCVTFINEVASVCEQVGADASEIETALRTEPRVGRKAYMRPGAAFAGGTLARDVSFLTQLGSENGLVLPLLEGILPSNREHRLWSARKLAARLADMADKKIAVLGLAYKPGTDALRRSVAVELCRWLIRQDARVAVFDPVVRAVPADLEASVSLASSMEEAIEGAYALVIATEWPEFMELGADTVTSKMQRPLVIDQNRMFENAFAKDPRIDYVTIGSLL